MNIKKISFACVLAAGMAFGANAGNIDANAARQAANDFIKQRMASEGMFKAPSTADIKLAHTEASSVEGNAYYVFNFDGGGWVIISGDDRAKRVLAYGDKGNIDMKDLPGGMMGFLNNYKKQIETAQAYQGQVTTIKTSTRSIVVNPLLKTNWGQSEPMNRLCPMNGLKRTSVGCGPLAMAQIMYYWKYPEGSAAMSGYSAYPGVGSIPALEATTFNYDMILDSYHIYNPETGGVSLGEYTDEQAYEVAKLCRYCGQACKARYGNSGTTGTGSYTYDQRDAFFFFGYNSGAQLIGKDPSYYCANFGTKYSYDEWKALICTELEASRPIPYHDLYDGHAWVLDGVDADGKFHMNWGFNERFNGWFELNSLIIVPYGDDEVWDFSSGSNGGNEMIIGMYPYDGYVIPGDEPEVLVGDVNKDKQVTIADVTALIDYLLSGDDSAIDLVAADVNGAGGVTIADVTALIDKLLSEN